MNISEATQTQRLIDAVMYTRDNVAIGGKELSTDQTCWALIVLADRSSLALADSPVSYLANWSGNSVAKARRLEPQGAQMSRPSVITAQQVQLLQIARGKAAKVARSQGVEFGEEHYQLALINVGVKPDAAGRCSSKRLTQAQFEEMMAIFEDMGFRDTSGDEHHWRSRAGGTTSTRQRREILLLHEQAPRYPLASLAARVSGGEQSDFAKLTIWQAGKLIEALKDIIAREQRAAQGGGHDGHRGEGRGGTNDVQDVAGGPVTDPAGERAYGGGSMD